MAGPSASAPVGKDFVILLVWWPTGAGPSLFAGR
jgi:hypothetical protein